MPTPELVKRWRVTETLLERACRALPPPQDNAREEYNNLLIEYKKYIGHNEHELALDMLEEIGHLVPCRGGF